MAEGKQMIEVEALKDHSTAGKNYSVGDTYEVPEDAVENLAVQGMAVRTDRVAAAKKAAKPADAPAKPARASKPKSVRVGKHKS